MSRIDMLLAEDALVRREHPAPAGPGYAKAVHKFMQGAAMCSVSKAPLLWTMRRMDLEERKKQLRAHIQQLHDHPDAIFDQHRQRKMIGGKPVPTQKEFARMLAMIDEGASIERAMNGVG